MGRSVSTAFGTNTDLFKPKMKPKVFDAFFPATFADWKRHKPLFAPAVYGLRACAVGYMYDSHEDWCWKSCEEAGVLTLPHVSAEALVHLYGSSHSVVITSRSDGGSQRSVLEAMAMNIQCIVMADSDKTSEYILAANLKPVEPHPQAIHEEILRVRGTTTNARNYIMQNWSEQHYADAILKGLNQII